MPYARAPYEAMQGFCALRTHALPGVNFKCLYHAWDFPVKWMQSEIAQGGDSVSISWPLWVQTNCHSVHGCVLAQSRANLRSCCSACQMTLKL